MLIAPRTPRQTDRVPRLDIADLAARVNAIARLTGTFTLRSGRVANEYFDKYRFEADPVLLADVAEAMAAMIPPGTEVLAGLELGGVPIATALSLHTGLPAAFVRKEAKSYGTAQLAEGAPVAGRRVLVIEDVVTTGGQVIISAGQLRDLGAVIDTVLCAIDRSDPLQAADPLAPAATTAGALALAGHGLTLRSALTKAALDAAL